MLDRNRLLERSWLLERLYLWCRRLGKRLRRNRDGDRVPVENTRLGSCVSAYVIDRSGDQFGKHRGEVTIARTVGRVRTRDGRIGIGAPADTALGDRLDGTADDLPTNGDVSGHHLTDRHGNDLDGRRFSCGRGGRLRISSDNRLRSDDNRSRNLRLRNGSCDNRSFCDYRLRCVSGATFAFLKFRAVTVRNAYTKTRFEPEGKTGLIHRISRISKSLHIVCTDHFARNHKAPEMEHKTRSGGRPLRYVRSSVRPLPVNRLVIKRTVAIAESEVERQRRPIAQRDTCQHIEIGTAGGEIVDFGLIANDKRAFEVEVRHRTNVPAHIAHRTRLETERRHLRAEVLIGAIATQILGVYREKRGRRQGLEKRGFLRSGLFLRRHRADARAQQQGYA